MNQRTNQKALRSYKNEYIKYDIISKLAKITVEALDMEESKNPAWLVEHNRKLRESAVRRTFKKTYEMQRKIEKDCCYNSEEDEEQMLILVRF